MGSQISPIPIPERDNVNMGQRLLGGEAPGIDAVIDEAHALGQRAFVKQVLEDHPRIAERGIHAPMQPPLDPDSDRVARLGVIGAAAAETSLRAPNTSPRLAPNRYASGRKKCTSERALRMTDARFSRPDMRPPAFAVPTTDTPLLTKSSLSQPP